MTASCFPLSKSFVTQCQYQRPGILLYVQTWHQVNKTVIILLFTSRGMGHKSYSSQRKFGIKMCKYFLRCGINVILKFAILPPENFWTFLTLSPWSPPGLTQGLFHRLQKSVDHTDLYFQVILWGVFVCIVSCEKSGKADVIRKKTDSFPEYYITPHPLQVKYSQPDFRAQQHTKLLFFSCTTQHHLIMDH